MSVSLEDRLIVSLHARAERLGPPPPGLADAAIYRGRKVRRRRRIMAAACAVLLAGAAVAVLQKVQLDDRSMPGTYATSINLESMAEGKPSAVPYMVGRTLVDDAGTFELPWPGLQIRSVWQIPDGYLVEASGPDSTSILKMRGSRVEELAGRARGLIVSADGMQYAWEVIGNPPQVAVADTYDGTLAIDQPVLPPQSTVVGFLPDERGFLLDLLVQPRRGGPISVWDFQNGLVDTGLSGSVIDAAHPGAILATVDGCVSVVDDGWTPLWRDCSLELDGAVSPSGKRVVTIRPDRSVTIRDAATGTEHGSIAVTRGTVGKVRWEDENHLVMVVWAEGRNNRVARCDAQTGSCEWAGRPPPAPESEADILVLGRMTPVPR